MSGYKWFSEARGECRKARPSITREPCGRNAASLCCKQQQRAALLSLDLFCQSYTADRTTFKLFVVEMAMQLVVRGRKRRRNGAYSPGKRFRAAPRRRPRVAGELKVFVEIYFKLGLKLFVCSFMTWILTTPLLQQMVTSLK